MKQRSFGTQFLIVSCNIYFLHIDFEGGKVVGIFTMYPLSVDVHVIEDIWVTGEKATTSGTISHLMLYIQCTSL